MAKKRSQTQKRREAIENQQQKKQRQFQLLGVGALLLLGVLVVFSFISNQNDPTNAEGRKIAPEVGAEAPDFELVAHTGETMTLSEYRGQPVAVMFMHTW